MRAAGAEQYCGLDKDGKAMRQSLCCPLRSTPDPDTCDWAGEGGGFACSDACSDGQIAIASSTEPYINDSHMSCFVGFGTSFLPTPRDHLLIFTSAVLLQDQQEP
jgi:chitinase